MNKTTLETIGIAALVALVVAGIALAIFGGGGSGNGPTLGAISRALNVDAQFKSVLTTEGFGGGVTATSSSVTGLTDLLIAANFDTESVIDYTSNKGDMTITLPASTTIPVSTTAGVCKTIWIRNATTTAAVDLTIAGNTGTLLKGIATTTTGTFGFKTILGDTDASNVAQIELCRKDNSDVIATIKTFID